MGESEKAQGDDVPTMKWVDFLENCPPGRIARVTDGIEYARSPSVVAVLAVPVLQLHCEEETCSTKMFYDSGYKRAFVHSRSDPNVFLVYTCRNCKRSVRTFAINIVADAADLKNGINAYKYGELPPFGPPTPSRVLKIIGPDQDLFLKGRRCESQGLGIAAFTYYRRVIEDQWARLLDEIIRVSTTMGAKFERTAALEAAKAEKIVTRSVELAKDAIPRILYVKGQNPIPLLYRALSVGVHDLSDGECLAFATGIRTLLADLAERMATVLKDDRELADAVSHLSKIRASKTDTPN
jgi:hypothetical protein